MMKDIDTYTLMVELCKRVSDYAFDPEPVHDPVLATISTQFGDLCELYQELYDHAKAYRTAVEARIEESE